MNDMENLPNHIFLKGLIFVSVISFLVSIPIFLVVSVGLMDTLIASVIISACASVMYSAWYVVNLVMQWNWLKENVGLFGKKH